MNVLLPVDVLRSRRSVVATVALAVAATSLPASAVFIQTNLVSNIPGLAIVNDPIAGQEVMVGLEGSIADMVSDGSGVAITPFALVGPDTNGRMVVKTAGSVDIVGHSLDNSTTLGAFIRVLIRCAR